jgi:hypothetical protein
MKTTRGIYLNILDSTYSYSFDNFTFYFSSPFYLRKFTELYSYEIDRFNTAVSVMYKNQFQLECDKLALVRLYSRIEKRGFYIKINGVPITCLNDITFELETKILV